MTLDPEVRMISGPAFLADHMVSGAPLSNDTDSRAAEAFLHYLDGKRVVSVLSWQFHAKLLFKGFTYTGMCATYICHEPY